MTRRMCDFFTSILVAGILYSGCLTPADAQPVNCATRPTGDSTNACASTAFVNNEIAATGSTIVVDSTVVSGGTNLAFLYDKAGKVGNLLQPNRDLRLSAVAPLIPSTVCTGSDDTATFQAAINSSSAHGNTVVIPALSCKSTGTGVSALNGVNLQIIGQGSGRGLDPDSVSGFLYTGTTGSLIKTPGATGVDLGHLRLSYNSGSYNGDLVDISQGAGTTFTEFVNIHDCLIGNFTGGTTAASLINVNNVLTANISRCFFGGAAYGIKGGPVTNIMHLEDNFFTGAFSTSHVLVQGQAWLLNSNSHEPANGTVAGAIAVAGTTYGLTVLSSGFQDALSGHYIDLTGGTVHGFPLLGNFINFTGGADPAAYAGNLGSLNGGILAGNFFGGITGTCAFEGTSAQNVIAFGNSLPIGVTLFCGNPTQGSNFYDAGAGQGFLLNHVLGITNYLMPANTSSDGLVLKNPIAATSGNQEYSPRLRLTGQGWKTNATAGNQTVDFTLEVKPVQGTTSPTANLVTSGQINGAGYTALETLFSDGGKTIGAPAGGDKGAGTLNAVGLYVGGVAVSAGGITALTGDVTASGSGSVPTTLTTAQPAVHTWALAQTFTVAPVFTDASGSRTALGLGALATVTPGTGVATALAINIGSAGAPVLFNGAGGTPSSIVLTNASGTASSLTAGVATNTAITDDTSTNATMLLTWVTANTGNLPQKTTSTKLTFNPSTGVLASTSFTGAGTGLTGTASSLTSGNVTTNANLTGDVTSVGNATTLTNAPVIAKVLTGYVSGAGTVSAADSILSAFQKINGNDALKLPLAGGTMSGPIAMGANNITGGGTITGTVLTSTIATGTAPFTVTSTTNVANLNASSLNGATFAAPGSIGSGAASTGNFTTIGATGGITSSGSITGTTGLVSGTNIVSQGGRSSFNAASEAFSINVSFVNGDGFFRFGASHSATPDGIFSNNGGTETSRLFTGGGFSMSPAGTAIATPGDGNIAATRYFSGTTGGLASKTCTINTANVTTGITITITGGIVTGTTTC